MDGDNKAQSVRTEEYLDIQTHSQLLSAAVFDNTFTIGGDASDFRLIAISLTGSAAWNQTVTITKVSHLGASYNTTLRKKTINAQDDAIFYPEREFADFKIADKIKVEVTNTGTPATTLYCELKAEFI